MRIHKDPSQLKAQIVESLKEQGFEIHDNEFCLPKNLNKDKIRSLHIEATSHKIDKHKRRLIRHEKALLQRFAVGRELDPNGIHPKLVEVRPDSKDELLFRYASLHWSIPVSSGYGRRLRFLVVDRDSEKLIGLFGLGDPVFSLKGRDDWIGWKKECRIERLHHVVDAYVLGAVPPYSHLLCGKLIALLTGCNEVREAFAHKYAGKTSLITSRKLSGKIAMVTTISALGRSSLYSRLKLKDRLVFRNVGFTRGFGEFQFSNGIYESMVEFAKQNGTATFRHKSWGQGFRNRREVIQTTLAVLGLPQSWRNHGIKREIYVSSLAKNSCSFLRGDDDDLDYYHQTSDEIFEWFRRRWLIPRSERNDQYRSWNPRDWALWQGDESCE